MNGQRVVRMRMWAGMLALTVGGLLVGAAPASPIPGPVPTIVGDWDGSLNAGGNSLRVVLHVTQDKDGRLTGTLDSPDQGATGIPISSITYKEPTLHFEIEKFGAGYDGTMNKEQSEIKGDWKQGGGTLPLVLKRTGK